jgi:hypothetical protein
MFQSGRSRSPLQFFGSVYTGTYPSEKAAVDAALGAAGTLKEEEMWAIIVVDKMDLELGDVDYMIRMNYTTGGLLLLHFPRNFQSLL